MATVQEWLGKDNKLGIDIWEKKYRYENETFDEWLDRVSGGNLELRKLIFDKKFMFGGRTTANRNTGKKASMMNCYSRGFVDDSLDDIMQANTDIAKTFKVQGGQGLSLSKLRPKGCGINNGQFASDGIIPFMEMFNRTTESISQGGSRKGALLISLDAWHKEAEAFIKIKSEDGKIQKANLSLEIDDEFMECVKKYYETGEEVVVHKNVDYNGNSIEYDVVPIKLYKLMMEKAYDWAEPGCIFTNQFRNYNLMEKCDDYVIENCNPCFDGEAELLTTDGYKKFKDLDGKNISIYNAIGNVVESKVWCNGEKDTVCVKTEAESIICTPEHRFMTIDGDECMAKDLKGRKIMPCNMANINFDERYVKYGFIQGDGQLSRLKSECHDGIEVNIGIKDTDIFDLFENEQYAKKSNRAIYLDGFKTDLITLGFSDEALPNRRFPTTYKNWSKLQKASFLHGCYSANGFVIKSGRVTYETTCKAFAEELEQTLRNDFDIKGAYITTNKPKKVRFSNGKFECRESYNVNIGKFKDITKFVSSINFYQQYKREQLSQMIKLRAPYVHSVTDAGKRKVYDFTEPERHWGIVDGMTVHNCGEQPLAKHGACNLGSLNLSEFVLNPFEENASFDFVAFANAIDIAVESLDKIIDENQNNHALEVQKEMSLNYRNIGLGTMGMWDMLCKMNLRYGSKESIELVDLIFGFLFRRSVIASSKLAGEKGAFPHYSDNVLESEIIKNHFTSSDLDILKIRKNGLRNCSLLSIAPTGSIGTMLNISTGCEPAFQISYQRKTESLKDRDEYYDVYIGLANEYMKKYNTEKLPSHFVASSDIPWKERVDMQSAIQRHIDTAISSTINLPNSVTLKEIEQLYLYSWEKGLKGVTIFRDGCKRSGILSTTSTKKDEDSADVKESKNLERGMIIKADDNCVGKKRTLVTGCGTLHCEAFFDPDNGELLETYLSKGSKGGCNNFMIGLSRMISLAARGGVDIYSIVDQLQSCGSCPSYAVRSATKHDTSKGSCCPVAVGNALLDMYREMQEEVSYDDDRESESAPEVTSVPQKKIINPCPECGEELTFEGGCNICKSCGYTKCD